MKRKSDKVRVKSKGCDSSFNCWIDKKVLGIIQQLFKMKLQSHTMKK